MLVSLNWLNDYIDLRDVSVDQLSKTLTSIGLEVEGVQEKKPLSGEVVIGEILEAKQHPNADKLRLTQVDIGKGEPLSIVCGAPNARAGIKVAVATIGSTLPGDFKIKESKIRGEKSFGMLCSEEELGLSGGHDGIIEFPAAAKIGSSVAEYFHMNDTIIEIGLTPNRSDCLGLIGLARDIAAKLGKPLKVPAESKLGVDASLKSENHVKVRIDDGDDSARFAALYVADVRAVPSPQWMQRRLQYAGMRPINILVDATNYAMLESGQPNHAYDVRDVGGGTIHVRRAKAGETLKTLDEQERRLEASDIVIADAGKAIGLAGIMGGANSEIKSDTSQLIIEVAQFNPSLVRKTGKRFALHTEASHRFERGIDVENIAWVARRVAQLIAQGTEDYKKNVSADVPSPRIAGTLVDQYAKPFAPKTIDLRIDRLQRISGIKDLKTKDAAAYLERLGFKIAAQNEASLKATAPSWRHDIEREVDLIEEVTRLYGYDKIPFTLPKMEIGALPEHPLIDFIDQSKVQLAQIGLHETISFPFMGAQDLEHLGLSKGHPLAAVVKLVNPLVEHHRFMRSTLAVGLIQALAQNRRNGLKGSKLFELARSFHEPKSLPGDLSASYVSLKEQGRHIPVKARKDDRPIEKTRVAAIIDAAYQPKTWDRAAEDAGFYHGKTFITQWLAGLGIRSLKFEAVDAKDFPWLHPGAAARVLTAKGEYLGWLGELHPRTAKAYELDAAPTLFELELEPILAAHSEKTSYISGNLRFPPSTRDVALMVPAATSYDAFMKSFVNFKRRKYLKDQRLFDIYQGQNLPEGKKSMAFTLTFQAEDKTLTDADVDKELEALLGWLKDDLSAEQR